MLIWCTKTISFEIDFLTHSQVSFCCLYRRSQPETVQYFQLNEEGNMFMYEVGTGCTGTSRLVIPRNELFLPSSNVSTKSEDAENEQSVKGNAYSMCPTTSSCTFHEPLPKENLIAMSHKTFSDETKKKIRWAVKMYGQWRGYFHHLGLEFITCDLDDIVTVTPDSLMFALCHFLMEVKKVDGSDFLGKTFYDIAICIQFHLEMKGLSLRIINDDAFATLKFTLDNIKKLRTQQGVGSRVWKAEVLSATDKDLLWSVGLLGMSMPTQLLNTVVFIMGKGFALRAGKEHRALHGLQFKSQLRFTKDTDGQVFLRCTKAKQVDMYGSDDEGRCPLCIILKYLSLLPKEKTSSVFYLQPRKKFFGRSWYINKPCGVNKLRDIVQDMCCEVGLPGFYSNHSSRSTACTKLYHNNIDEQIIQEISGHRSLAVHS